VKDEGLDLVARGNVFADVWMSAVVWALVTLRVIDLCGSP
jgi:hypothetical protein